MWPFRTTPIDPVVRHVGSQVVQQIGLLFQSLEALEGRLRDAFEAAEAVKRCEPKLLNLERLVKRLEALRDDDVQRVNGAIEILRGQINGPRGGRPRNNQAAADLGERVMEAMRDPAQLATFIAELQALHATATGAPNTVDPVSIAPKWNPRAP